MPKALKVTNQKPNIFQAIFHHHEVVHTEVGYFRFCHSRTGVVWGISYRRGRGYASHQLPRQIWREAMEAASFEEIMALIRKDSS